MIVLTGAGGFIGSVVLGYLNKHNIDDIVLFDDLPTGDQFKNLINKRYISLHSTEEMFEDAANVSCVIHIGANSSTLETNWNNIYKTNVLSTRVWNRFCLDNDVPFIFTSSAAIYGNGHGPLNHYAFSKQLSENEIQGVVLRLFNVYGPNEYHKGRMSSTIMHWHNQLQEDKQLKLFQASDQYFRDFIYVEDVAKTILHFIENYQEGIYDLGTGTSKSFDAVADQCLSQISGEKVVIQMPEDLKKQYQKNTCADVKNLKTAGVDVDNFVKIEEGIKEYFNYLRTNSYY